MSIASGVMYLILNETMIGNHVMVLDLQVEGAEAHSQATLPYRLFTDYRSRRGSLVGADGRGLRIKFTRQSDGLWQIVSLSHNPAQTARESARGIEQRRQATTIALLEDLQRIKEQLETGFQTQITANSNWWNLMPTLSTAIYDDLRGLGHILELEPKLAHLVHRAYEDVQKVNEAAENVNRILTMIGVREKAMKDPNRWLGDAWLAAYGPKQDFLQMYPELERALKTAVGRLN